MQDRQQVGARSGSRRPAHRFPLRRSCPNRLRLRRACFLFFFLVLVPVFAWPFVHLLFPFLQVQPFSQKSRTATVPKVFQIGLCGVVEADLELFWYSWSAGFLGERLYAANLATYRLYPFWFW